MGYDLAAGGFRPMRPQLAAAPLCMRDLMLASRPAKARAETPGARPRKVRNGPFSALMLTMLSE